MVGSATAPLSLQLLGPVATPPQLRQPEISPDFAACPLGAKLSLLETTVLVVLKYTHKMRESRENSEIIGYWGCGIWKMKRKSNFQKRELRA